MKLNGWSLMAIVVFAGVLNAAEPKPDSGPILANDFGPADVDVAKYPAEMQEGYKLMKDRCAKCHTSARPLNAQYAQPAGDTAAQDAAIEGLKKSNPELFKDKYVLQIETDVWKRFVKRMMGKPGANISKEDAKKIYEFLAYDSQTRKIANPEPWIAARGKMLAEFKAKHSEEYKKTYAAN